MRLLIDVGNTTTVIGVARQGRIVRRLEVKTEPEITVDRLWKSFSRLLGKPPLDQEFLVASVVPAVSSLLQGLEIDYPVKVRFLTPPWSAVTVKIKTASIGEVGADRVAAAEAVYQLYGGGFIVDYGTATTVEVVSPEGEYLGGTIMPGIGPAASGLSLAAAKLPQFTPRLPKEFGCDSTLSALQSGLFYGTAGAVKHLLGKLQEKFDLPAALPVVGTGGRAGEFAKISNYMTEIEPDLVLKGLLFCENRLI